VLVRVTYVQSLVQYRVIYDVLKDSADAAEASAWFWRPLVIGIFAGILIALIKKPRLSYVFVILWVLMWFAIGFPATRHVIREEATCKMWARSGQFSVVEGRVSNFRPMPYTGHAAESFTVNGLLFSYSDFDKSKCGFRNTASHGGPIREGLQVRIAAHAGRILKLEVAE
jgi:hypothetical protein